MTLPIPHAKMIINTPLPTSSSNNPLIIPLATSPNKLPSPNTTKSGSNPSRPLEISNPSESIETLGGKTEIGMTVVRGNSSIVNVEKGKEGRVVM